MSERRLIPRSVPRKSATKEIGRIAQDLAGRCVLLEMTTVAENGDPIAELDCLVDVVGHDDDRLVDAVLQVE